MTMQDTSIETLAHAYAETAAEAYGDQARYLRSLPEGAWDGPTGCADWTVRDLAGHVVGEAVWFPTLVRGVTQGEAPLPDERYQSLKTLPAARWADTLEQAAHDIPRAVGEATSDQLQQTADVGFTKLPLWRAAYLPLAESIYHNWDLKVGRDATATIPTPWAVRLAGGMTDFAPMVASKEGASAAAGRYLLQVGDGVGPVTVIARDGRVTLESDATGTPDVTLHLTADQYARIVAGRLDLVRSTEQGDVTVEGDRSRALALNSVFQGI